MSNQKDLILFSSNSRDLYKEDIFNTIALPDEHVLQFRYSEEYIDPDIKNNLEDNNKLLEYFIGKKCLICYINNTRYSSENISLQKRMKGIKDSTITIKPIRIGEIIKVVYNKEISRFLFYVKLNKYKINSDDNEEIFSKKFSDIYRRGSLVSNIEISNYVKDGSFKEVVESILPFFENKYFYKINIMQKNVILKPHFNPDIYASEYKLNDGKDYIIEIITYENITSGNSSDTKSSVVKIEKSDELSLSKQIDPGGSFNLNRLELSTSRIEYTNKQSIISFIEPKTEYKTNLVFKLNKPLKRAIFFSIAAIITLFAIPIFNVFVSFLKIQSVFLFTDFKMAIIIIVFLFLLILGCSLTLLYQTFNKK